MNGGFDLRQWNGPFIASHTECSLAERKEPEMLVRICGPWLPSIYLGHELRSKYLKNVEINYSTSSRYKEQFQWVGRSSHAGWKTMMNDDRMYLEASPALSLSLSLSLDGHRKNSFRLRVWKYFSFNRTSINVGIGNSRLISSEACLYAGARGKHYQILEIRVWSWRHVSSTWQRKKKGPSNVRWIYSILRSVLWYPCRVVSANH